ncbi:DUF5677 domain-containing protein [Lunatimonas salinarum]|uniref:DUF5677 domain-containing protein n=1 Tax=Lunatimonas salinarum TaxID=1774590 RepID=UPI001AE06903|nr:DUF5677 domain-containing protein [Lunatimonas salinarum]
MNPRDKISILFNEAKKVKLQDLQKSLNEIIILQGFLIQKVYELKPKLREGEVYIETLITKLIFASKSVLRLSTPQDLEIYNSKDNIEIIDTPSIFILTRSIIETFLTLEYLFFDTVNDLEKDFRFKLWRVSGFMSRQAFADKVSETHLEKLKREEQLIEEIKKEIKSSAFYPTLKSNDLWKLDKFGLPRLKSWGNLLESSRLKSEMFQKIYSLYSNYAHSEYLAMMQLNEGNLNKGNLNNISNSETALLFTQMINSVTILLLKERFVELEEEYGTITDDLKVRIELWSGIATK